MNFVLVCLIQPNETFLSKGITLFIIALALVSVVVSFTEIKCGKPVNDSTTTKMAVLPLAVILVKILWSITNL